MKKRFGKKAILISHLYVTLLELSVVLVVASFFSAFANQMKIYLMSASRAMVLLLLVGVFIWFKNWMRYNGKKRNILNASRKTLSEPFWKLILVPIVCLGLSLIFLKSI